MDKHNSILFLDEIFEHLRPYGDLYVSSLKDGEEKCLRWNKSAEETLEACGDGTLQLDFSFYGQEGDCYSAKRIPPFKTAKYFVKGQGASFAKSMKQEVANKLFGLS